MDEFNKDLEETISNSMAYQFARQALMTDKEGLKMIQIAMKYGLKEKSAVLMILEMGVAQNE